MNGNSEVIRELGQALGLFDSGGGFDSGWMSDPVARLRAVLTNATQREALGRFLDEVIPGPAGDRAGYHPLLWSGDPPAAPPLGNVFVVFEPDGSDTLISIAGEFHTSGAPFELRAEIKVPLLVASGDTLEAALGDGGAPLEVGVSLVLPPSTADVRIEAVNATVALFFGDDLRAEPRAEIRGFRLGAAAPRDLVLDSATLSSGAWDLVLGLMRDALANVPEPLRSHLLPALGLDASLPRLPIEQIIESPEAFRTWLVALADQGRLGTWFGHVAALFGASSVTGAGSYGDPFRAPLLSTPFQLAVTLGYADGRLYPGITARVGSASSVHLAGDIVLLGIPLRGGDVDLLPEASVTVRSPTPLLPPVMASDGTTVTVAAGGARAGFALSAGQPSALLELTDVVLAGRTHARIDLTNLDQVGDLASGAIEALLLAALGNGAGRHVLALVGVVAPASPTPGDVWTQPDRPRLDFVRLLTDPIGAVAQFHREAVTRGGFPALLREVGQLLGLSSTSIPGGGTLADPWSLTLAAAAPLGVRLVAYRTGDVSIRFGIALAIEEGPFRVAIISELIRLDVPAAGEIGIGVFEEHHALLGIGPVPRAELLPGSSIRADRLSLGVRYTVGSTPVAEGLLQGVTIVDEGSTLAPFDVAFPFSTTPSVDNAVLRALVRRAATRWSGEEGMRVLASVGLLRGVLGIPNDFPELTGDLTTPIALVRPWLRSVLTGASADGKPFAEAWLRVLSTIAFGNSGRQPVVSGAGAADDPWRVRLDPRWEVELLGWLDPVPLTAHMTDALAHAEDGMFELGSAVIALRPAVASLREASAAGDAARLATGFEIVDDFLAESDGVVPVASQAPTGVTTAATVTATHVDAIGAATSALTTQIGGAVAVLVSAPFGDHTTFASLIGTSTSAHFDFRQPTIPYDRVDLRPVTAIAPFYTADLAGTNVDELTAQIERVIDHLATIRPGVPVVLVGHSLSGVAAVRAASTRASRVSKVVTIGAPLLGAVPPYVDEETVGRAVHVASELSSSMPDSATRRGIEMGAAIARGVAVSGSVAPIPVSAMTTLAPTALPSGVPVVAVVATIGRDLRSVVAAALRAVAPPAASDVALRVALATSLDAENPASDLRIRTDLQVDFGSVGLDSATRDASAVRLRVVIELERASGFLLGGPGTRPDGSAWPARVRRGRIELGWSGNSLHVDADFVDASIGGPMRRVTLDDVEAPLLLDAIFASIADAPEAAKLFAALRALGLLVEGAPRLLGDALAALRSDGHTYLAPRLRSALSTTFYGHDPATGVALGPVRLFLSGSGLRMAIEHSSISGSLELDVTSMQLTGEVRLRYAGVVLTWRPGALLLAIPPWLPAIRVAPTATATPELIPRIIFSVAFDALLSSVLPVGAGLPPLDALLSGRVPLDPASMRLSAPGIRFMLRQLGVSLGMPERDGLFIAPAGLLLTAAEAADDRVEVRLSTETEIGGVLGITAGLQFGGSGGVTPSALLSLSLPDPPSGAGSDAWRDVSIELGLDARGVIVALVVGTTRVTFLPEFSGWSSLIGGGVALLPRALDEITRNLPSSPIKTAVLDVASALDLYGPDFSSHTADFQALGSWTYDVTTRGRILGAIAALLDQLGLPGTPTRTGAVLTWQSPALASPFSGRPTIGLDWTNEIPALAVNGAIAVELATGGGTALERVALQIGLDAVIGTAFRALASIGLDRPLGTGVIPKLEIGVRQGSTAPEPVLRLLPLASETAAGPLDLALLPTPTATLDEAALPASLGFDVLLPLISALLERATGTTRLWPGGPTLPDLVTASGLFDASRRLVQPPPEVPTVLGNIAAAMSVELTLGDVVLVLGRLNATGDIGVAASGFVAIPIDTIELRAIFGTTGVTPVERTSVTVFRRSGSDFELRPAVSANHFGIGVRGAEGAALISTDNVRLVGADAYTYFDVAVEDSGATAEFRGVGVEIADLGISLGAGGDGSNAIASGLMKSTASGDSAPAQPAFGIALEYKRPGPGRAFQLGMRLAGSNPQRAWIGIRAGFGPLYIDQVGIELEDVTDPEWIAFLIDGGVSFSGFAAQVDDLSVRIPLSDPGNLALWQVDLAGLAIAYSNGGVSLLGGLLKRELEPPAVGIEYVGMLQLRLQNIGAIAVGAWSKQIENGEEFDSFFVFAAVFLTISFPPYFELQALGAGFGYNRALIVPEDMNAIPSFSLIRALDDPSQIERPMELLESLRMPVRRGTLWFAAGIRGALFVVVDVIAVVYVALDKGLEIGLVGLGRLAQPKGSPIVTIELAVKARYSSAEGVLSIQAQLTDNSWLFIRECQLTGGFALFIWFPKGKFVLTIGGYHPSFQPEPEFPIVPRLGFRCNIFGVIQLKGEMYFALTNSCVMAGTRLEAAYDIGWLRAWFRSWADFLISWDPFHYDISIGIELGADFNIEIDLLFGSINVHFSISVGAQLWLIGPPLHGEVRANLGPISITVPFGDSTPPKPPLLTWPQFRDRYVLGGDVANVPLSVQPDSGLSPPEGDAAPPQGTSRQDAWRLVPEFSFVTTTAMPASKYEGPNHPEAAVAGVDIDIGPMGVVTVDATHRVTITRTDGGPMPALDPDRWTTELTEGDFPEAVWRYTEEPNAGANNVRALAGVKITATAEALNPSAPVPILTLVDEGDPLPLPFAAHTAAWRAETVTVGEAAMAAPAALGSGDVTKLLMADAPSRIGAGLSGSAARSLRRRKSPPVVAPLSEGLDLAAVGRGTPERVVREVPPLPLRTTKLAHAALLPVEGAIAPAITTRASAGTQLPRRSPPRSSGKLGRLERVTTGIPQTSLAAAPQLLLRGPRARKHIDELSARIREQDIRMAAGAVQLWRLGAGHWRLDLRGDAARVVALGRAGTALLDVELSGRHELELPEKTESLALWSLGRLQKSTLRGRGELGALSLVEGPRAPICVGWHVDALLQQVDPLAALARGSRLRWSVPMRMRDAVLPASRVLEEQTTVETTLPRSVGAILVIGDVVDPTAALRDDLDVRVAGGTLGAPIVFDGELGEAALYPAQAKRDIAVTVNSVQAMRLKGVLGFRGDAEEIARRLHGEPLVDLVVGSTVGSEGSISVSLTGGQT